MVKKDNNIFDPELTEISLQYAKLAEDAEFRLLRKHMKSEYEILFGKEDKMEHPETTAADVYSVFRTIIAQQLPRTIAFELAIAYARVGLELSTEHLRTHALYLLANLQEWRGVEARECKRILGSFISKA